jgi:hypothetical protein
MFNLKNSAMKHRILLAFCAVLMVVPAFSQTKMIAFKSHSGSAKNFRLAFTKKLFDMRCSNFGAAPQPVIRNARLDSVIYISRYKSVMVTSSFCINRYATDKKDLWSAGKDTVYNHPLFTQQHSLDSIKKVILEEYYFQNSIDEVKFIGFDNARNEIPKQEVVISPVIQKETVYRNTKKEQRLFKPGSFSKGWQKFRLKAKKAFKRKKCATCPTF